MNASKEEEEEEEESWETVLQKSHIDQWKSWDSSDTTGNIKRLDHQLQAYSTSRLCCSSEEEENGYTEEFVDLIPGIGCVDRPLVFFVVRHLSKHEKYNKSYFEGKWVDFMKSEMGEIGLKNERCYYAYLFPFTITENYPSEDQERIFLPYLAKRIELMGPKVVVGLGKSVCKYLASEFVVAKMSASPFNLDKFLEDTVPPSSQPIQNKNNNKKKKKRLQRFTHPKDTVMMGSPHPYSILLNRQGTAFDQKKERRYWESLHVALEDFLFPHRISGPRVYDPKDGKYKINPLDAVSRAARMEHEEKNKRKREEKNTVPVGGWVGPTYQ